MVNKPSIDVSISKQEIHVWRTTPDTVAPRNYVVSGDDVWLPGIFDSAAAALAFASLLTIDEQVHLWEETSEEEARTNPGKQALIMFCDIEDVLNARLDQSEYYK